MANSTMSLYAMYTYEPTLFDDIELPVNVQKEILVDNLILECAELEILYTNPNFLKDAITSWSKKQQKVWDSLNKTFDLDYNPIWNVDGTETIVRELESTGNDTNKVVGFNSTTLQTNNAVDTSGTVKETITNTRGGNIGVTMTQQMLERELNVRPKLNIYNYIIHDFKQRFCLLVY